MPLETTKFDVQDYLKTPEEQAAYIATALEDGDVSAIAAAIGDIARARGVTAFAKETGLSREAIYKTFKPGGNPTLDTLAKATGALGLRLSVVVANDDGASALRQV
jgi:probable addiction module antidote protein